MFYHSHRLHYSLVIDQSGANHAGLKQFNENHNKRNKIRQCKCPNNIIVQDHRHIKRNTRPILGRKNFYAAHRTIAAIEFMAMIKKRKMKTS
ncbi:MAG: DDE-type integrase/transposase/recombinase [Nitrospirales bacterium]|nr:DDE-type integrase/transposase/recombinase [Nitrospirales bacterium]